MFSEGVTETVLVSPVLIFLGRQGWLCQAAAREV